MQAGFAGPDPSPGQQRQVRFSGSRVCVVAGTDVETAGLAPDP